MTPTQRILDQIASAQKLSEGASEGPWGWEQQKEHGADCFLYGPNRWGTLAVLTCGFPSCDFIAASRMLVPRLARQLEEAVKALERISTRDYDGPDAGAVAFEALSRIEQLCEEGK